MPTTTSKVCTTDVRLDGVGQVYPPQTQILATPVQKTQKKEREAEEDMAE